MKKSLLSLGMLAATTSPYALAENNPYQFEIIPSYGQSDQDPAETDTYNVSGVVHFKSVNTEGHPLEEAAYLNRSSFVTVSYQHDDTDNGINDDDDKDNTFGFGLHMNTGERYFVDLNYLNSNMEDGDIFSVALGFGGYIGESYSAHFGIIDTTVESDDVNGTEFSGMGYNVGGKGVIKLGGEQAVAIEGDFTVHDFDDGIDNTETFDLAARYYFLSTTHVGLGYSLASTDDEDTDEISLEAQHFITPKIAVGLSLSQESSDDDNVEDTDAYNLWAKFRF